MSTTTTTYYEKRLAQYGLTPDSKILKFRWEDTDIDGVPQHAKYFREHDEGIEILTPNVYGSRPNNIYRRKKVYISRLRIANPTRDEDTGQLNKYRFTTKWSKESAQDVKDSWLFIPPLVYDAVRSQKELRTLYVIEGEFKAFIGAKWGLPIVGIPGIHNFREKAKGEMLDGLKYIINTCGVENVVQVYDSDLLDLSSKVGKNQKPVDSRPRSFLNSSQRFRKLLLQEGVNVFLAHPHPRLDKVGLDDLMMVKEKESKKDFETRCRDVIYKMTECIRLAETGQKVDCDTFMAYDITRFRAYDPQKGSGYVILNKIFKLEGINSFYEYHKTRQLKDFTEFLFQRLTYQIQDGVPVVHDNNSDFINPVYPIGNSYFINGSNDQRRHISDFTLKIQYIIYKNAEETIRIASIVNTHNESQLVELSKDDLVSLQAFLKRLRSWPRYNFFGTSKDMNLLIALWEYNKDLIYARMVTRLGWQANSRLYAYANGVLDEQGEFYPVNSLGLVSVNEKGWFIPTDSEIESLSVADGHNDKNFRYQVPENRLTLTEWAKNIRSLQDTGRDPNGLCIALFSIMAVYSDLIYDICSFVPMLYLAGIPQSGKSSAARTVVSLFGQNQKNAASSVHSTTATAFNRLCSHFVNGIVWLEEYKNDIPKWKQEVIKNSYDRTGKTLGTYSSDDQIKRVRYNSAIVVSGQDIPGHGQSDPALANRGILCQFRSSSRSEESLQRFRDWEKQYQEEGFTYLMKDLIQVRQHIENQLGRVFGELSSELQQAVGNISVSVRLIQNFTALMAPAIILQEEGVLDLGSSRKQIVKIMAKKVIEQEELSESGSEISVFWRILEELFTMKDPEGKDGVRLMYELKVKGSQLTLRLDKIYNRYYRYGQRNGRSVLDEGTLKQYLINHRAFISKKNSEYYRNGYGSAMVFDRNKLPEARNIMTEQEQEEMKNKAEGLATYSTPPPVPEEPATAPF